MCFASLRFVVGFFCVTLAVAAAGLDREIVLAPQVGPEPEDVTIRRCQARVEASTASRGDYEALAWAFVAKARRTLDAGYYKLAERTAVLLEERFGTEPAAQLLQGHVLHNLHRFRDAENVARKLIAERGRPEDFALLSDALMEQGDLPGAVAACQRCVDLRPGLDAYSRVAHLRWLKGDLAGATTMMEAAMRAAGPVDAEARAWVLTRLSSYYLQAGNIEASLRAADAAIRHASDYAPALLARGRGLVATGQSEIAVAVLERAAQLNPLPEYQWWLADTLRAIGRAEAAVRVEAELVRRGETSDPRTLGLYLATRGQNPARAVRLARDELAMRGDGLTHDALAWALFAQGEIESAAAEIKRALAFGTQDARLQWHAAEIAARGGEASAARRFAQAAQAASATLTPGERARLAALAGPTIAATRQVSFSVTP
jgi:tetratricopeptide (TPR) repeat protein